MLLMSHVCGLRLYFGRLITPDSVLSSDQTELTASVIFSHAASFLLFVMPPAISEPKSNFWFNSTLFTSISIPFREVNFLCFTLFAIIAVRGRKTFTWLLKGCVVSSSSSSNRLSGVGSHGRSSSRGPLTYLFLVRKGKSVTIHG